MKNLRKIGIATVLTLITLGTGTLAKTGIVNAPSGLVLRKEGKTSGEPITTLPDKAELNIIEESGEWYKVQYNSQEGYAYSEYVNLKDEDKNEEEPSKEETPSSENGNTSKVKRDLKVYNLPLITSTVVNEIKADSEVTIHKNITNWCYVSSGEIYGWVRAYGIDNASVPTVSEPEPNPPVQQPEQEPEEKPEEKPETQEPSDNTNSQETTSKITRGVVDVDYANVRSKATTNSEIVTTLTRGTTFAVTAETEEWYKIKYTSPNGTEYIGYMSKSLAKSVNN